MNLKQLTHLTELEEGCEYLLRCHNDFGCELPQEEWVKVTYRNGNLDDNKGVFWNEWKALATDIFKTVDTE